MRRKVEEVEGERGRERKGEEGRGKEREGEEGRLRGSCTLPFFWGGGAKPPTF